MESPHHGEKQMCVCACVHLIRDYCCNTESQSAFAFISTPSPLSLARFLHTHLINGISSH